MASKRLMREYKDIKDQKEADIFLKPSDDNIFSWYAMIIGPKDSPFEGKKLILLIIKVDFLKSR